MTQPHSRIAAIARAYALRQHADAIAQRSAVHVGAAATVDGHEFRVVLQQMPVSHDSETLQQRRVLTIDGALLEEQWHGFTPDIPTATPDQWSAFATAAVRVAKQVGAHPATPLPSRGRLGHQISRALD